MNQQDSETGNDREKKAGAVPSSLESSDDIAPDHAQFVSYFARDNHRIFAYIFSLLHNRADAEDVYQRTSLILWQEFGKFDQTREFAPWACGIAFYTVKNFLRVAGRKRLTFSNELMLLIADDRIEKLESADERIEALDLCLKKLPAADKKLIDQAYSSDVTIKTLAEQLDRAVQTLYNRLNRIRRTLVECVDRKIATQGSEA